MALTTILLAIPLLGVLVLLFWTREAAQSQVKWVAFVLASPLSSPPC